MKLAGFNFTKMSVEKKTSSYKDLKINTNLNLISIEEAKQDFLNTGDKFLSTKFSYSIEYSPEIAKVEFEGNMLVGLEEKQAKEVLDQWKKKKLEEKYNLAFFNVILTKSNIKALSLEEEFNLPHHFKLPTVSINKEKKIS